MNKNIIITGAATLTLLIASQAQAYTARSEVSMSFDSDLVTVNDIFANGATLSWLTTAPTQTTLSSEMEYTGSGEDLFTDDSWQGTFTVSQDTLVRVDPFSYSFAMITSDGFDDSLTVGSYVNFAFLDAHNINNAFSHQMLQQDDALKGGGDLSFTQIYVPANTLIQFSATVGIDMAAATTHTPIPAAAWLLGSGLLGIIGMSKKQQIKARRD